MVTGTAHAKAASGVKVYTVEDELFGAGNHVPVTAGELVDAKGKLKVSPMQKGPICVKAGVICGTAIKLNCLVYLQFVGMFAIDI